MVHPAAECLSFNYILLLVASNLICHVAPKIVWVRHEKYQLLA